ncbi:uncharacterized protein N7483_007341 [Penicillium malachiteum]|uniref:uncharacterized protein n=1 Tax=Penicillium malachiteum TaxID=1324776 RepID=UPI00254678A0|nr:uncharacterized protein N7483_007341 [Penicillium malachiteum]KAJ5725984.1 hypothetical protein N7483_007341 [Penicillium malachiteum]
MGSITANPFQDIPEARTEPIFLLVYTRQMKGKHMYFPVYWRIVSTQTLGASGGCHAGAVLLRDHYEPWKRSGKPEIFIPDDTWCKFPILTSSVVPCSDQLPVNHPFLFKSAGIKPTIIPYFNHKTNSFDFEAFTATLRELPAQSVILIQSNAQNPTGSDPSPQQWRELATIFSQRGHLAFFDAAYPGFASGDIDTDLQGVRFERVGLLSVLTANEDTAKKLEVQMKLLARAESGAPPDFGSKIVETVLSDEALKAQWREEVRDMANRLKQRRLRLREGLEKLETPGNWNHITEQNGMFSYIGLSVEQVTLLRDEYHVYLQDSSRISIAGLNNFNIDYVARSISAVVKATTK